MSKIDKEVLVAEIERLKRCVAQCRKELGDYTYYMKGEDDAYDDILYFIDSLPNEPVSEDFKNEYTRFIRKQLDRYFPNDEDEFIYENDWEDTMKACAEHFSEWQMEQGKSKEVIVGLSTNKLICEISEDTLNQLGVNPGDKVIIQIRKV